MIYMHENIAMLEKLGVYVMVLCMVIGLLGGGSAYAKALDTTFEKIETTLASAE